MGIISDRGYLKHSLTHRLERGEMNNGTDVNYFDFMEEHTLALDNFAHESVSNKRWSP